ncbi:MAG: hypothetical protein AB1668_03190 [Nanoarchaeota archaeon]
MDVDRIQKVNALALNLMKQGLAQDREEAVVQAEKIYREIDAGSSYQSVRERMGEIEKQAAPAPKSAESVQAPLKEDKIKEILEQNAAFMVKKIKEFQEQMQEMRKEMDVLKNKMLWQRPAQEAPAQSSSASPAAKEQAKPATQSHPRSGNYKEEDVSIEKFFYMGR